MRIITRMAGLFYASILWFSAFGEPPQVSVHGYSWLESGRIQHAGDSAYLNYNGNLKQSYGALVTTDVDFNKVLSGEFGIGAYLNIGAFGSGQQAMNQMVNRIEPLLTAANLTLSMGNPALFDMQVTGGFFPYKYNPYTRNLGLYLFQGPVYPGLLYSGFETFATSGVSTLAGFKLKTLFHSKWENTLLFLSEVENKPYFDMSLAYVTSYKAWDAFEIGAGINLYHLISANEELTTPGKSFIEIGRGRGFDPWMAEFIYIDTTGSGGDSTLWDTTFYTHRGIKLDMRLAFDFKRIVGTHGMGPNEFILYGEAAILGVQNHGFIYDDLSRRIPLMAGFKFPTFRFLDECSFEFEYYGARYRNDATNLALYGSPIPARHRTNNREDSLFDVNGDNIKWSLYAARTFLGCLKMSGQVANDHLRSAGNARGTGGAEEVLATPGDWYWMLKLAYFF